MARIVIADDHGVVREGLSSMLNATEDWEVIAEAQDGFEVIPLVEKLLPDLLILDLTMPNLGGVATILRLQKIKDAPSILVLSARDDDGSVGDAMHAGAKGYIPKSAGGEELKFAIRSILKGLTYVSPTVANGLIISSQTTEGGSSGSMLSILTPREREVMKLLTEGHPNRDVARILHISPRTIDSHRANVMKKLGVNSNAELVQMALRYGLID